MIETIRSIDAFCETRFDVPSHTQRVLHESGADIDTRKTAQSAFPLKKKSAGEILIDRTVRFIANRQAECRSGGLSPRNEHPLRTLNRMFGFTATCGISISLIIRDRISKQYLFVILHERKYISKIRIYMVHIF